MNKISEVLPHVILKNIVKTSNLSLIVSSIPGFPNISVPNDSKVKDVVFFAPHVAGTGESLKDLFLIFVYVLIFYYKIGYKLDLIFFSINNLFNNNNNFRVGF